MPPRGKKVVFKGNSITIEIGRNLMFGPNSFFLIIGKEQINDLFYFDNGEYKSCSDDKSIKEILEERKITNYKMILPN